MSMHIHKKTRQKLCDKLLLYLFPALEIMPVRKGEFSSQWIQWNLRVYSVFLFATALKVLSDPLEGGVFFLHFNHKMSWKTFYPD
jgi:hypothetical protein